MKKRIAFFGAILSLIPLGQPLLIKTGVIFATAKIVIFNSDWAIAESAEFYNKRGDEKYVAEDYKGAISDYTKAIKINPQYEDAYNNRGNVKLDINNYKGAISDYTKAIEINPQYGEAYNNRGLAKRKIGDDKGGCDDYKKAIALGNKETEKWFNTGGAAWCRDM